MEFKIFNNFSNLHYGLSEKSDGSMKLTGELQKDKAIVKNRETYFSKENIPKEQIVSAGLVHRNKVEIVNKSHAGQKIPNTDGLVASAANLFLTLTVADCFPIYFYEPFSKVIGLAHAGWRSIVKSIIPNVINIMVKDCSAEADKVLVGVGPGIQNCHFEVQEDILADFNQYSTSIIKRDNKIFIDLQSIIFQQLRETGVQDINIQSCDMCTYCLKDNYFSYRRDKPEIIQTMVAYIGLL